MTNMSNLNNNKNTEQIDSKPLESKKPRKKATKSKSFDDIAKSVGIIQSAQTNIPKADFVEQKSDKSTRKSQVIDNVFGIKKDDNLAISKRQKILKICMTVLFISFMVISIGYTAYKDFVAPDRAFPSWEELGVIFKESWKYLLFALIALFLNYFFKGLKLSVMCKSLTKKWHLLTCLETGIIGNYYNAVTPLAVGGQPFEIYHLSKHGVHGGVASSMPIAAFMLNQFAFVILASISLYLFQDNRFEIPTNIYGIFPTTMKSLAIIGLICCTVMPLLVVIFSLTPKIGAFLVHFVVGLGGKLRIVKKPKETTMHIIKNIIHNSSCLNKICKNPLVFIASFILSFLEHFAIVSLAFFVLKAFGYDAIDPVTKLDVSITKEWLQAAQVTLILTASIAFIPTPGNSGAADLSFFIFFEAGLAAGLAFPATMTWRLFAFYSYIIIGFVFATLKKRADHKRLLKEQALSNEIEQNETQTDENSQVDEDNAKN